MSRHSVNAAAQREAAILARLRYAERVELGPSGFATHWKLSRVIWRAGELRIRAAEPLLWFILRGEKKRPKVEPPPPCAAGPMPTWSPWTLTADQDAEPTGSYSRGRYRARSRSSDDEKALLVYSAAWALGRCGTAESIPRLRAFAENRASPAPARRIALESIRLLMTDEERAEAARQVLGGLPPDLAAALLRGDAEEFPGPVPCFDRRGGRAVGRGDAGGDGPGTSSGTPTGEYSRPASSTGQTMTRSSAPRSASG